MANATSQVTIIVNNGVYAGGIKVVAPAPSQQSGSGQSGEGSTEEPGKILLQIIAADAYTTDEEGNMRNMKITTIISAGMPARCR